MLISVTLVHDLEANGLGTYNETVLNLIDQLMVCPFKFQVPLPAN